MKEGSRLTNEQVEEVRSSVGTFKVIFLAMIGGVILFTVIAVAISRPLELELPPSTTSLIFIGLAVVSGVQGLVIPRLLRAAAERKAADDGPVPVEQLVANWFSAALVGIDSLNIDDTNDGRRPVHSALLAADVPIVEHLTNLDSLPEIGAHFFAVPVKVKAFGTFPVRAFAKVETV